jgi:hypothetical protein
VVQQKVINGSGSVSIVQRTTGNFNYRGFLSHSALYIQAIWLLVSFRGRPLCFPDLSARHPLERYLASQLQLQALENPSALMTTSWLSPS